MPSCGTSFLGASKPLSLSTSLKHKLQPELNIPRVVGLRLDLPEGRIGQVRHRRAEHGPIERIGKFRAELDLHPLPDGGVLQNGEDRKSTRLNSSHVEISYAVFCLKKKIK